MDSGANKEIKSRRERADMERTAKRVTRLTLGVRRSEREEKMNQMRDSAKNPRLLIL